MHNEPIKATRIGGLKVARHGRPITCTSSTLRTKKLKSIKTRLIKTAGYLNIIECVLGVPSVIASYTADMVTLKIVLV